MNREKIHERSKAMYGKSKGFMAEFSTFIMRGNVMDMAVGVIVGAAFQKIISSLVDDIIMPVISMLIGGIDFSNWFLSLDGSHYKTLAAAKEAGAATLNYGVFITAVINFVLMAFVIFSLVKFLNHLHDKLKKEEEEVAPTTRKCPYCKTEIDIEASRCPNCTSKLEFDPEFKPE